MRSKTGTGKIILILAVMLLLLRPFVVYHIAAAETRLNPERAWSLLQRLVKKKDEHTEHPVADAPAFKLQGFRRRLTVKLLPTVVLMRSSLTHPKQIQPGFISAPFIATQRYRYHLTSCLLI